MALPALCALSALATPRALRTAGLVGDAAPDGQELPFVINQAIHHRPSGPASYSLPDSARLEDSHGDRARLYAFLEADLSDLAQLSHSRDILTYVSTQPFAPLLAPSGCLFLPTNDAWRRFYAAVERPYPPYFGELVAGAFYPDCGNTSLSGITKQTCPSNSTVLLGDHGCFAATRSFSSGDLHVFSTDGFVGLPEKWAVHISWHSQMRQTGDDRNEHAGAPQDVCSSNSSQLKGVPGGHRLLVPVRFVVCTTGQGGPVIGEDAILDQMAWMNEAYGGRSPKKLFAREREPPQQVDMQMAFELKNVTYVLDEKCAKFALGDRRYAARHNARGEDVLTVVIVSNDQTGMLGRTGMPVKETDPEMHLVAVTAPAIRGSAGLDPGMRIGHEYSEGDTLVHETGHALGLYHTFQNGCDEFNDLVGDTEREELPNFVCRDTGSCGSKDPLHNFMDYSPDSCMFGFTEMQKRRAWCVLQHYRPELFEKSIRKGVQ